MTEEIEQEHIEAAEVEAVEADQYSDEAQQYGWKPADQWHGEGHMSAEKYMTRGPGKSAKLESQVAALTRQVEGHADSLTRVSKAQQAAADARVASAKNRIREEMRQAAETGDVEVYDKLSKQEADLSEPQEATLDIDPESQQLIGGWIKENPAYNPQSPKFDVSYQKDIDALWAKAQSYGIKETGGILKFIDDNYQAPKPRIAPAMGGGGSTGPLRPSGDKGWDSIPAEDRKAAKVDIDEGLFDDLAAADKITPHQAYANAYFAQ